MERRWEGIDAREGGGRGEIKSFEEDVERWLCSCLLKPHTCVLAPAKFTSCREAAMGTALAREV